MTDTITLGAAARGLTGRQLDALTVDIGDVLDVEAGLAAIVGEPAAPAIPAYGALYRRDPDDGRRFRYLAGCSHDAYVWYWDNAPDGTPGGQRWFDDEQAGRLVPARAGGEGGS